LTVTEEFSFVGNQGVRITITFENRSPGPINAGARFLLDTCLGEASRGIVFTTNQRTIDSETLVFGYSGDRYWIDQHEAVSLIGSISTGNPGDPDSVHFANWKKLSDASWKAAFQEGRNFNSPPYSVRDAAVCYYFDPQPLGPGEKRSFGFTLSLDMGVPAPSVPQAPSGAPRQPSNNRDLDELMSLIDQINAAISSGTSTEEELEAMERALGQLRAKYGMDSR
jgi:hypothetical protein